MKHASRIAQKQRSAEDHYAILQGAGIGPKGIRVAVHTVVEATTSRHNFYRPRFRKAAQWPDSRQHDPEAVSSSPSRWNPHAPQSFTRNPQHHNQERVEHKPKKVFKNHDKEKSWQRRENRDHRRDFRNLKRKRDKRQVDNTFVGGSFDLPPMSNEWNIKKKKKKRKRKTTTDVPPTKQMQKKSKKFRIYMESSEVTLAKGKAKGMDVVRDLSKELDQLLAGAKEQGEEASLPQLTAAPVTKSKYVPIPKNWQNPPSWRPPTRGSGMLRHAPRGRWKPPEAAASQIPQQITEAVTEFDWRGYDHPNKVSKAEPEEESLVLKPGPADWPEPTHPADGLYDWHKSQMRNAPRTPQPLPTHSISSLSEGQFNRYNFRGAPRVSRHFVGYTSAPTNQRILYRSNSMWQTRAWIPRVQPSPASTWPTIGTKPAYSNSQWGNQEGEGRTELDINQLYFRQAMSGKRSAGWASDSSSFRGRGDGYRLQGAQGFGHQYSQQQQGSWRGTNHTNYYNHYYQQFYGHSNNYSAGFQFNHQNKPAQGSSYYFQNNNNNFYQNQARTQSRVKPPSYFFNALNETIPTLEAPYRFPDEYTGNDRDLRAPPPTPLASRSRWTPARFRPAVRRKPMVWAKRRPTGYRSIFTVPLQKDTWNSTLPHRIL